LKIKILDQKNVKKAVTITEAISAVRDAFIQLSTREAVVPMRSQIRVAKTNGISLFMPAYLGKSHSLGAKIVSVFLDNPSKNLPTIFAVVIILDADTGQPKAVLDGTFLTALRTGAASGAATDLLARQDVSTAAVFGAGIQGRTQMEAVCTVRNIEKIWIYDPDAFAANTFARELKEKGDPFPQDISTASSPEQAASQADIICTATTSYLPVFNDVFIKPGIHINGVGSYTPEMQEIPEATIVRAKVFVDSVSACWEEAGDLIIPFQKGLISKAHVLGEIGELAAGQITGRDKAEDITFFKSVGLAVQDVAVAQIILHAAEKLGLGQDIEL
jgi:ornithine cyclodeaminase/alanine dehydrogenase-like protein (mu-crystallin family)